MFTSQRCYAVRSSEQNQHLQFLETTADRINSAALSIPPPKCSRLSGSLSTTNWTSWIREFVSLIVHSTLAADLRCSLFTHWRTESWRDIFMESKWKRSLVSRLDRGDASRSRFLTANSIVFWLKLCFSPAGKTDQLWTPLHKKVLTPTRDELLENPRARSAKLRCAFKNY